MLNIEVFKVGSADIPTGHMLGFRTMAVIFLDDFVKERSKNFLINYKKLLFYKEKKENNYLYYIRISRTSVDTNVRVSVHESRSNKLLECESSVVLNVLKLIEDFRCEVFLQKRVAVLGPNRVM